ncbi:hypothetical protein RA2_04239 [Roseovarius sp. A-2]|nr:hypothetical protein RA2_04239 [Roseovarius sp. A-2]
MLLERGIDLSYETVRRWTAKFGPQIARNLRRRQRRPGDVWHLDEVVVKIAGRSFWLWRAVDQDGVVLDEILQARRDKRAAKRLLVRLMKRWGFVPRRIITDKLRSYGAAKRELVPGLDHWSHKGLNNRAENSHLPFRKRELVMQGFRSPGGLQRFVSMESVRSFVSCSRPAECRDGAGDDQPCPSLPRAVRELAKSLSGNYRNACPGITEIRVRELPKPAIGILAFVFVISVM